MYFATVKWVLLPVMQVMHLALNIDTVSVIIVLYQLQDLTVILNCVCHEYQNYILIGISIILYIK